MCNLIRAFACRLNIIWLVKNATKMGPKYRFPLPIDFKSCREEIAGSSQEFCNRSCKREHVESNALNSWKLNIFKIIDGIISFYFNNLDLKIHF